jgi:hypothetical protein
MCEKRARYSAGVMPVCHLKGARKNCSGCQMTAGYCRRSRSATPQCVVARRAIEQTSGCVKLDRGTRKRLG